MKWGWIFSTVFFCTLAGVAWGWYAALGTFLLILWIAAFFELLSPSNPRSSDVQQIQRIEMWQDNDDVENVVRRENPTVPVPEDEHPLIVIPAKLRGKGK